MPVYPASGSPGDRETLRVAKGTKHPVGARVLINWMISPDFINAGWTQDPATGTETNKWNLSKQDYLQTYFGGINAEGRKLAPKWAAAYYPPDPAAVTMTMDFSFVAKNNEPLERVQGPAVSQTSKELSEGDVVREHARPARRHLRRLSSTRLTLERPAGRSSVCCRICSSHP